MAPMTILSAATEASPIPEPINPKAASPSNNILHRTPWRPPTAVRGKGVYIELEDGTRLIDAVGGAAVNCIGSGHPKVLTAINEQLQRLVCAYNYTHSFIF